MGGSTGGIIINIKVHVQKKYNNFWKWEKVLEGQIIMRDTAGLYNNTLKKSVSSIL